jgi:hypothetical protein
MAASLTFSQLPRCETHNDAVDLRARLSSLSTPVLGLLGRSSKAGRGRRRRVAAPEPSRRQVRLSDAEIDALVADYVGGLNVSHLAVKYAIHRTTVLNHLERRGVARGQNLRKLADADVTRAARMYSSGASLVDVGEVFGVASSTVAREVTVAGVVMPRAGRSKAIR